LFGACHPGVNAGSRTLRERPVNGPGNQENSQDLRHRSQWAAGVVGFHPTHPGTSLVRGLPPGPQKVRRRPDAKTRLRKRSRVESRRRRLGGVRSRNPASPSKPGFCARRHVRRLRDRGPAGTGGRLASQRHTPAIVASAPSPGACPSQASIPGTSPNRYYVVGPSHVFDSRSRGVPAQRY
jgi:hypothetical protein